MSIEIERKFLVKSLAFKEESYASIEIKQGFLNSDKNRTVRIRVTNNKGFITVKGKSNKEGTTRFEWEKEISKTEALQLLKLCEKGLIEKTRYLVKKGKNTFEVDEFFGENEGLVVAEIELEKENEPFEKPNWLGKEVTGEINYYNSAISKNPFKNWK
jgi:CYTH domain-containing protein